MAFTSSSPRRASLRASDLTAPPPSRPPAVQPSPPSLQPILTFDPPANFGSSAGLPQRFLNTKHYYYLSRFAWVFYLIALFFAVVAFLLSVFALFARLGAYLSGFTVFLAVGMQAIAAALMT